MKPWDHLVTDHTLSESKMREIQRLFRQAISRPTDANLVALHQEMGYTRLAFDKWEALVQRHPSNYAIRCFWLNVGKDLNKPTYIVNVYESCQPSWKEDEEPPDPDVDHIIDDEKMSLEELLHEAARYYINDNESSNLTDWWQSHPDTEWGRDGQPECHHTLHVKYTRPLPSGRDTKGGILVRDYDRINAAIGKRITDADQVRDLEPFP